ncbi:conserved hypothetical protein [Vibrio chagasii]|nr:conserved hypothetical protein [Vibrio chagasii]CAH7324138.1 conserved hypothetical protein [Vibrio chagasii]CAH7446411.1 conserved hypothetical protein [Vibrio chagasii]CAH7460316.1 conserved hypothetical protein [Vibrio chagasii]
MLNHYNKPNVYKLTMKSRNSDTLDYDVEAEDGTKGFIAGDIKKGGKIYLLAYPESNGTVIYVGQTKQAIHKRFYPGIVQQQYKWASSGSSYILFVWDVDTYTGSNSQLMDCIESELTFSVRASQGGWPLYQTAIKFRVFNSSPLQRSSPHIANEMMNSMYDYFSTHNKDKDSVEGERKRTNHILSLTNVPY